MPRLLTAGMVLLLASTVCSAGWRADCRAAARECRKTRGASLTIPLTSCESQNCSGGHCVMVNGQIYVRLDDALFGVCSLPRPPDCSLCSAFCSSTTTSTTVASTTTP